jgi:hypothetical protein
MPFGERHQPGATLWAHTTPVTTAASPLLSPWLSTDGFSQVYTIGVSTGGTTTVTLEWGFDGASADANVTPTTVSPLVLTVTLRDVLAPFMRVRWDQTVANATVSKITLKSRL